MSVIFCLLPSSSTVIPAFYLFSTDISEQHVWELLVWIQHWFDASSPGTPVNNPITLISPVQSLGYILAADSIMRSSANFRTVFSESQNANPLVTEPETHFNAKWPFKVIQGHLFRCHRGVTEERDLSAGLMASDGGETELLAGEEEPFLTDDLSEALVTRTDVKDINLQIKTCVFTFIKKHLKTCIKH